MESMNDKVESFAYLYLNDEFASLFIDHGYLKR